MTTFEKITALLDQQQASYRVVEHEAIGQTEQISQIRGNLLGQAAKAMVLEVSMPDGAPSRQIPGCNRSERYGLTRASWISRSRWL